jgi:sugar (pentulose or hexulose) kinase
MMPAAADLVLTIDAGGSGVKVTVFSAANARLLACVRGEYRASFPEPGRAEFDPAAWWMVIVEACRDAVEQAGAPPRDYAGLTCTGMRAPFVLVNGAGEHVAPGVLVPDRRGAPYLEVIERTIGRELLYERTGHWLSSRFGLAKLLWFARAAPRVFARARHVLQLHDWLVLRFSGAIVSEPSSASMSQLLDIKRRAWASDLLGELGLSDALLPPLLDAGTPVGGLLPHVAEELGLLAGTPVHTGGGDTHISALGMCAVEDGAIAIVAGSTTAIQLSGDVVPPGGEEAPLVSAHLRPGRFALETNAGETGVIYRWLAELASGDDADGRGSVGVAALERLACAAPLGARELLVTAARPRWGEAAWSRLAPVTLFGLRPEHSLGDLARAAIECATYATAAAVGVLVALRQPAPVRVRATGGASRSALWAQVLADVLGRDVEVADIVEPSAIGGAQLVCPSAERDWGAIVPTRSFEPQPERHARYAAHAARYRDVFARLDAAFGEAA